MTVEVISEKAFSFIMTVEVISENTIAFIMTVVGMIFQEFRLKYYNLSLTIISKEWIFQNARRATPLAAGTVCFFVGIISKAYFMCELL